MGNKSKKAAVYTEDDFLFQKILLDAPEWAEIIRGDKNTAADIRLVDVDTAKVETGEFISMSRRSGADISLPFPLGMLADILSEDKEGAELLTLSEGERSAYLRGEKIRLTELEYALLDRLMRGGGEYISKEDILRDVWNHEADAGIINVYVHYLREKLEKRGEKIILSSRKCGYKIDEKYTGGKGDA